MSEATLVPAPNVVAFLEALPHADPLQFVSPPGLGGTWRAKFIRAGLDKGVLVVHWSGAGLCIVQPSTHGACADCKGRKGSQPCEHCACSMCAWLRQTDERASPRVSRARMEQLTRRLRALQLGSAQPASAMLDEDF